MDRRCLVRWLAGASMSPLCWPSSAQEPALKLVYPYAPGGAGDALARLVATELQRALDRPVIVDSRTGASGRIGVQSVRDAAADGTTLLFTPSGPLVTLPHLGVKVGYEPEKDFAAVQRIAAFEVALAIDSRIPATSLRELIAWLKANPTRANYGTPGVGSQPHLAMIAIAKAADVALIHVPYRGTPQAMGDLVGGNVSMLCAATGEFLAAQRSGKVRLIAVAGEVRSVAAPDVPTLKESGIDVAFHNWYAIYAPIRTPAALLERLASAAQRAMRAPGMEDRVTALGFRYWPGDPDTMQQLQRSDSDAWQRVVQAAALKVEE